MFKTVKHQATLDRPHRTTQDFLLILLSSTFRLFSILRAIFHGYFSQAGSFEIYFWTQRCMLAITILRAARAAVSRERVSRVWIWFPSPHRERAMSRTDIGISWRIVPQRTPENFSPSQRNMNDDSRVGYRLRELRKAGTHKRDNLSTTCWLYIRIWRILSKTWAKKPECLFIVTIVILLDYYCYYYYHAEELIDNR